MSVLIRNRKNQNVAVLVEKAKENKGLAFVMHGLGGFKEQPHIKTFADAFLASGFSVVRFDTTHSFGESDGNYEDATTTNYYEDLEDVIKWAKTQDFYAEPFFLAGHSLGGISVGLYAENAPGEVKGVALISTVVSGALSFEAHDSKELEKWKKNGIRVKESATKPGQFKTLKWSHMEDRLQHDLLLKVNNLTMPVLLIVGEQDTSTPPKHQKILYEAIPGEKELHVIKDAPHTFREEAHLHNIKNIFLEWIQKHA